MEEGKSNDILSKSTQQILSQTFMPFILYQSCRENYEIQILDFSPFFGLLAW